MSTHTLVIPPFNGKRKDNPGKMDRVNPPLKASLCKELGGLGNWAMRPLGTFCVYTIQRILEFLTDTDLNSSELHEAAEKRLRGEVETLRATPHTAPVTDKSTQTTPPITPTRNSVSTNTDTPSVRTYAEAATSTIEAFPKKPRVLPSPSEAGKGKGKEERTHTNTTPEPFE
ncbi:hypothetical protein L211DRAFT_869236 [Terfezia boudieri ATCC MYA-4762]|uniref:Uncharacterized protein n=1 Tax=Terfezia boudieri ATCC MYA-4762 TaxID=1051890 RepID=A0A3N4LWP6_9PEZI|nr:hypothetical protein L211DRAFT_869236 [Terfezia boudieri ATCC MYA-4762]